MWYSIYSHLFPQMRNSGYFMEKLHELLNQIALLIETREQFLMIFFFFCCAIVSIMMFKVQLYLSAHINVFCFCLVSSFCAPTKYLYSKSSVLTAYCVIQGRKSVRYGDFQFCEQAKSVIVVSCVLKCV